MTEQLLHAMARDSHLVQEAKLFLSWEGESAVQEEPSALAQAKHRRIGAFRPISFPGSLFSFSYLLVVVLVFVH